MIGTQDIEVQAKNPNLPLWPLRAYINSPSSLRLRNVPKKIGQWEITSVQVNVNYPDKTQKTAQCVLVGGVWVGTVEGSSATGSYTNGYTVLANGIDENGNPVSGYVLGRGDVEILKEDGTPIADDPTYFVTDDELDAAISSKAEISDVVDVANDLADLSNSLSGYYTKTETSSAVELDAKFETKADLSALNEVADSLSDYYTKSETSSTIEIQTALDGKQPTGDYALTSQLPTKTSELSNDSGYITSAQVEPSTSYGGYAANSDYATKLKALDMGTGIPTDRGTIIPTLAYDSATNTYTLDLYGSVGGYYPWNLHRLFGTDFSPAITLEWRKGTIWRKRVIGGTTRWSIVYNNNLMWVAKGQYAITCPTGDGKPDGNFYVLNYEDETHPNYINDPATDVHTITYGYDNITSIDGQAGGQQEQAIWCTRTNPNPIAIWERPFAYRNELSAKADLSALTNYYTKSETSSTAEIQDALDLKADNTNVEAVATDLNTLSASLSDYYVKNETSSATEIQTALDTKQPVGNYLTAHQSLEDYYTKSETSSAVEIDALNSSLTAMIGEASSFARDQAEAYTDSQVSAKADLTALTNYYTKSETSGNVEISTALALKQDKLSNTQVSSINAVVDERSTIVKYRNNPTQSFYLEGYIDLTNIPNITDAVEVKIGTGVKELGSNLFNGCQYLTKVTIPNTVTRIYEDVFKSCYALTSIDIPDSVSSIDNLFGYTGVTASIVFGSGVTSIPQGMFHYVYPTSVTFRGKTLAQVQAMTDYPWDIEDTSIIKTYNIATQEWVLEQLAALSVQLQGGNN